MPRYRVRSVLAQILVVLLFAPKVAVSQSQKGVATKQDDCAPQKSSVFGKIARAVLKDPAGTFRDPTATLKDLGLDAQKCTARKLLDNGLPLILDATITLPSAPVLPGGPFRPRPLELTVETLTHAPPAGDYDIPVIAFCTEWSVHQGGRGTAYQLAPLCGKAAAAIATMLWRGLFDPRFNDHDLQAVSWAIQSGTPFSQMPLRYQHVIDALIPDFKTQLDGNFLQHVEQTYTRFARITPRAPSFDSFLREIGKPGELALSAKRQQQILLQQDTTDQHRDEVLFAAQESGVYRPVTAEEGPWTVLVPGVAYARFQVVNGNMGVNTLQLRVLPQATNNSRLTVGGIRLVNASYVQGAATVAIPTLFEMLGGRILLQGAVVVGGAVLSPEALSIGAVGLIGYSVGAAAQALIIRPAISYATAKALPIAISMAMAAAGGGGTSGDEYKKPKPGLSGKEGAKDVPSWARGFRPKIGESGRDFATRLMDEQYGKGNWTDRIGVGKEFNQIQKWGDRAFIDP